MTPLGTVLGLVYKQAFYFLIFMYIIFKTPHFLITFYHIFKVQVYFSTLLANFILAKS